MMSAALTKLKTILEEAGLFDAVTIGESRSEKPDSMSQFAAVDEDSDSETLEMLGLFRRRHLRVRVRVRAYRANPYEAAAILETIGLSDSVEDLLAGYPTLDGLVRSTRLVHIRSLADEGVPQGKPASYRERILTYELTAFEENVAVV